MSIDNLRDKLRERFAAVRRPVVAIPAPKIKPSGLYQHFETDADRQVHLQQIEDNKDVVPF